MTLYNKMLGFIKKCFFTGLAFLSALAGINSLSYISMNNQGCKVRPQIVSANSEGSIFFPFSIKTNKFSGSCNSIKNPHATLCVSDILKNLNVRAFNLMTRTNETRHMQWHETCKCECSLNSSVSNNNQCWYDDKCLCECKELIDKSICNKEFIWNPSNC